MLSGEIALKITIIIIIINIKKKIIPKETGVETLCFIYLFQYLFAHFRLIILF